MKQIFWMLVGMREFWQAALVYHCLAATLWEETLCSSVAGTAAGASWPCVHPSPQPHLAFLFFRSGAATAQEVSQFSLVLFYAYLLQAPFKLILIDLLEWKPIFSWLCAYIFCPQIHLLNDIKNTLKSCRFCSIFRMLTAF